MALMSSYDIAIQSPPLNRFGMLGLNASETARVRSRFGLLGFNASVTSKVISNLVWFVRV